MEEDRSGFQNKLRSKGTCFDINLGKAIPHYYLKPG